MTHSEPPQPGAPERANTRWAHLVTCEHASFDVPDGVDLGLARDVLESHVSFDRGTRVLAEKLATLLAAPLHLGSWSRLVVDLNRREENPDVIVTETYGVRVPGNASLTPSGRVTRIAEWHRPYRAAARADAQRLAAAGGCLHLSMHSFDPGLDPAGRAFDAGVLFDPEREPEASVAASIAAHLDRAGWSTRLNEPYAGVPEGLTSWLRDQLPARAYIGIEIEACYRWMDEPEALARFATDLAEAVRAIPLG